MFNGLERMIALRWLREKRQEGFISVVAWFSLSGIMLGVATLIIVMSVMNGFRAELLGRIIGLNGHVSVIPFQREITNFDQYVKSVVPLDGVAHVTPMIEAQVMATANGGAGGAVVRGIIGKDFMARTVLEKALLKKNLQGGNIDAFSNAEGIFIGIRMANRLRLEAGQNLKLISPQGTPTAFGHVPRVKSFKIIGIFNVGMYEYDNSYIYMPLAQAQNFFRYDENSVNAMEIVLEDENRAPELAQKISEKLNHQFRVSDWQEMNRSFFNALQVERNVMFLILTLIILVAAFNVISSQIMLVRDKGRGIAILRTMGISRAAILRIFFMTGSSVGIIGTAAGAVLGISFSLNIETIRQVLEQLSGTELFAAEIYFLSHLPAKINMNEVLLVIAMALGLSFLASVYPAWRAARIDPVEILRYE